MCIIMGKKAEFLPGVNLECVNIVSNLIFIANLFFIACSAIISSLSTLFEYNGGLGTVDELASPPVSFLLWSTC